MKKLSILILSLCISLSLCITSFASTDYKIYGAGWEEYWNDGVAKAAWEPCDKPTSYMVRLYKKSLSSKSSGMGSAIGKAIKVTGTSYDYSEIIRDNGTGLYTFTVYPVKGSETTDLETSDILEVDSDFLSKIKKSHPKSSATVTKKTGMESIDPGASRGWWGNPDGTWGFVKDNGSWAKNEWIQSNGFWYYFDSKCFMLTGWQYINNAWYYLEPKTNKTIPQGAMYSNCTTPDGYTLNESGQWVQNGAVVTSKSSGSSSSSAGDSLVKTLAISCSPNKGNVTFSVSYTASLKGMNYTPAYDQWKAGQSVTANLTIEAKNGYKFDSKTKFTMSNGSVISNTGDEKTRHITVTFKPSYTLANPGNFYISEYDEVLHWDKVENASRYKVVIKEDGTTLYNNYVTNNWISLSSYGYYDGIDITVQACNSGKSGTGISNSSAVKVPIGDEILSDGVFKYSGGNIYYYEYDEKVKNEWREIMGYWYHFGKNGAADKGWYHDKDDSMWYYFDANGHMLHDTTTPDGYQVNSSGQWVVNGVVQY